jgi:hypothetical protein
VNDPNGFGTMKRLLLWFKQRRCQAIAFTGRQCRETAITSGKPAFCAEHKNLA